MISLFDVEVCVDYLNLVLVGVGGVGKIVMLLNDLKGFVIFVWCVMMVIGFGGVVEVGV